MKLIVFIITVFSLSNSFGHDYHFAFAEANYNDISQKVEVTLTVSTHDLEYVLSKENQIDFTIKHSRFNDSLIGNYLLQHFEIESNNKKCQLKMIGFEVLLNGICNFYFESKEFELTNKFIVRFDLLMNHFSEQQNKLTFYYQNSNYTWPFVLQKAEHIILLDKI